MTLMTQLTDYQCLKQQQSEQIEAGLQHLNQEITQQLEPLLQQEQKLLDAQAIALASLRAAIEMDTRCLLHTPQFKQFVEQLVEDRTLLLFRSNRTWVVTTEPTTWLLTTLPFPLEIIHYETIRDDHAYDDENYYTDYRYNLTAQFGCWQKKIDISTASLSPGNPMSYYESSICTQHHDVAYALLEQGDRSSESFSQHEFSQLNLAQEQTIQLKQEMSCLLAFVGNLFNLRSRVECFRYPQRCTVAID